MRRRLLSLCWTLFWSGMQCCALLLSLPSMWSTLTAELASAILSSFIVVTLATSWWGPGTQWGQWMNISSFPPPLLMAVVGGVAAEVRVRVKVFVFMFGCESSFNWVWLDYQGQYTPKIFDAHTLVYEFPRSGCQWFPSGNSAKWRQPTPSRL